MAAGLAVSEDLFHPSQFNWLVYKSSNNGGGLSTPEGDARIASYYGVGSFPTLKIDGTYTIVGAPADAVDGRYYIPVIESHNAEYVPLAMAISDYSFQMGSAFAEVKLKLFGDLANIGSSYVRIVVVENDVPYGGSRYDNVVRRMLPDQALTISQTGQEQTVNLPIPMSAGWVVDNLWLIAFVQRDTDRYVFNSTSSRVGEFAVMAGVDGPRQVVADDPTVTFGTVTVLNVGYGADVFDISLKLDDLPADWDAHLTYDGEDLTSVQFALAPFEAAQLTVTVATGALGSGRVSLDIFSQGAGDVVETLTFNAIMSGADLLVVADDGGAGHAYTAYRPALAATGMSHVVWHRDLAAIAGADMLPYQAVIWASGGNAKTMNGNDRVALDAVMSAGGRMLLAGEDLIESLNGQGGSAPLWLQLRLRFLYQSGNSGNLQIAGLADDPIGDGLSFTLSGGDPDQAELVSGQPVEASCNYGSGQPAVLRTIYNDYKVVFMPFGLERVPTQELRDALLLRSLAWLDVLDVTGVGIVPGAAFALHQNAPNPFNPRTEIAFRLDRAGDARLEIFNARGQRVRALVDGAFAAGDHTAIWDGRTASGETAAAGTYFYRLTADGRQMTRKMSLIK